MSLVLVGLNYKTAPLEIREQVAFSDRDLGGALRRLREDFGLEEGMIVSTCNRVEVIAGGGGAGADRVKAFLYSYHGLGNPFLEGYLYSYWRKEVVRHVFRVASSLDSMVVGEPQILSQLKQAFSRAVDAGSVGPSLNRLLPRAFFVAKRVRRETRVGAAAVSVSSVAVELARKIFDDLAGKTVLVLGAGKMSELAVAHLVKNGASRVLVANRTFGRSAELAARIGGTPVAFEELESHLIHSDIVVVSTGASQYVLEKALLQTVIRERRYAPLFVIDISVPRNVDPAANEIENVFLYDIDDLQAVVHSNVEERQKEAGLAEEIVEQEVRSFVHRSATHNHADLIVAMRQRIEEICLKELERRRNSLNPEEFERLERTLRRAAARIAHPLIVQIKKPETDGTRREYYVELLRDVFDLEEP